MKVQVTFSIEENDLDQLDWLASGDGRSRSGLINKILIDWMETEARVWVANS